jgi:hypothetical protein
MPNLLAILSGEGAPCVVKIADDKGSMLHELKTHPVLVYGKDYEIAPIMPGHAI